MTTAPPHEPVPDMLVRLAADAREEAGGSDYVGMGKRLHACAGALEALAALWPIVATRGTADDDYAGVPVVPAAEILALVPADCQPYGGTDDPVAAVRGLVGALNDLTEANRFLRADVAAARRIVGERDETRRRLDDTRQALATALDIAPGVDLAPVDLIGTVASVVDQRDRLANAPQPTPCPDPGLHRPDTERVARWNAVLSGTREVVEHWRENRFRVRPSSAVMDALTAALDTMDENEPAAVTS